LRAGRDFDWVLFIITLILCLVGLAMIYSVFQPASDEYGGSANMMYFNRQLMWLVVGMAAMFLGFVVPFRFYESLAYVAYALCVLLLIVVLFMPNGRETQRWLVLGPVRMQPSEFTKIALLFVWARVLAGHRGDPYRVKNILSVLALLVVPFLLVLKQPDLGTAIVLMGLLFPVLYWRGVKGIHILYVLSPIVSALLVIYGENVPDKSNAWPFGIFIVIIFVVAYLRRAYLVESIALIVANLGVGLTVPLVWNQLKPYQQDRIVLFLDPGRDKLGAGWQVIQSKIAIGSGGFNGKGYLEGTQKALEFLPARHTDFVFSVLGEELGFIGAALALVLFGALIIQALSIAQKTKSEFASTVCVGIAAYFFIQVLVNVGMTTGMAPVTGIPLPFISYGGSSLVASCFMIGFLLNCSVRWYEY
jgi:rod shape determining protein RodA